MSSSISYNDLKSIQRVKSTDSCTFTGFFLDIFIGDFDESSDNCIFRNECPNFNTFMVVMTVCYTYCLLKFCILVMVLLYQRSRVKGLEEEQNTEEEKEKLQKLKPYRWSIVLNIYIEIAMAFRDFFLFRGLGYFVSYLYEIVFVQIDNVEKDTFSQCMNTNMSNVDKTNLQFYLMTADTCLSRFPFFGLQDEPNVPEQKAIMIICIILWIILECLAGSMLFFNTQVLSQVNEEGKERNKINEKIFKDSLFFFVSQLILISVLIFYFQIRLYFRFQSSEVLTFYLIWKTIGFMLLLDQFNKKNYLSNKLAIDISSDKKMDIWTTCNESAHEQAQRNLESFCHENDQLSPEMKIAIKDKLDMLNEYLKLKCEKRDKEIFNRFEFKWKTYLIFVLCTLLIGIIGLACCLIHYSLNESAATDSSVYHDTQQFTINELNTNDSPFKLGKYLVWNQLYWFGFILCMLESAIFEIFNSVLLLHGYYLEIFKQIQNDEKPSMGSDNNDTDDDNKNKQLEQKE